MNTNEKAASPFTQFTHEQARDLARSLGPLEGQPLAENIRDLGKGEIKLWHRLGEIGQLVLMVQAGELHPLGLSAPYEEAARLPRQMLADAARTMLAGGRSDLAASLFMALPEGDPATLAAAALESMKMKRSSELEAMEIRAVQLGESEALAACSGEGSQAWAIAATLEDIWVIAPGGVGRSPCAEAEQIQQRLEKLGRARQLTQEATELAR